MPLRFALTSASVMNAFFVPQLGSMIYTMNGMATQLNLRADAPGTFEGLSAHYSGDGFSDMRFEVRALAAEDFAAWLQATRGRGPALDAAAYTALNRPSPAVAPSAFGSVAPGLFGDIVSRELAPGPGPANDPGGAAHASPHGH